MNTSLVGPKHLWVALLLVVGSACGPDASKAEEASQGPADETPMMSTEPGEAGGDGAVSAMACNGTAGEWHGCRGTGCSVCSELVKDFPYYFQNHPSCQRNTICYGQYFQCNSACPPPTEADRTYPAACNGTAGQWNGCRGTGCSVCEELVKDYPCYFTNHPGCAENPICYGQYFQCNSKCPAPTQADRCYTPPPPEWCGNGICEGNEPVTCPFDCSFCSGSVCPDGSCCPSSGVCSDGSFCPL
ncbi:hypothetical protein [Pyxidicoccus xibeiensis]|uniref:hypothetical protein n=1 Tax=Pyxidicoccus xibeiensis TaxID=2906759 RepID=UPI0020A6E413|nr:hypothetical protein [Pyxidicoccus xibeiensis]MCP3138923.1 hypothetical protein [Pyxidicoccus xibeiensis]